MAVANRTLERGENLAARFGARPCACPNCPTGCTSSTPSSRARPAACPSSAWARWSARSSSAATGPMFMVDLAVPRDIEPEVAHAGRRLPVHGRRPVGLVQSAGEKRQAAVQQAEAIIDAGVQSFAHWLDQRAAVPLIQALNRQAEDWGTLELARARKLLAKGESVEPGAGSAGARPDAQDAARHPGRTALHRRREREHLARPCRACSCARAARTPGGDGR
jgi:glutamyl-tRNA reductase